MLRFSAAVCLVAVALAALPATASEPTDDATHDHAVVAALPAADATAVRDGRWSDTRTWGGTRPATGDDVVIPAGVSVVLDTSPPHLSGVKIDGALRFARKNLTLKAGYVMVHGRLQVGTRSHPFTQRATIVLDGPVTLDAHGMGHSVLGVMGGVLDLHGAKRTSWTRLQRSAPAGSRRIRVGSADGWSKGDRIVVASTDLDPLHAEARTIAGRDGMTLTLDRALNHHHHSDVERVAGRKVIQRAEVGLLTRTVVVRGAASSVDTGIGGHVMIHDGSVARIGHTEFTRMGQAGVMGRYPIHFHLVKDASTSWVRGNAIHNTHQRCLTIHGTHKLLVERNVGYESRGHCYFFEDAVETGNRLAGNLGLVTRRPLPNKALLTSDATPATFWVSHPTNTLVGNVAAGSVGNGFWYDLQETGTGLNAGVGSPRTAPMGRFHNNVAHSNHGDSTFRSNAGLMVDDYTPPDEAVFGRFTAYKNEGFGVWADGATVDKAILAGNKVGFLGRDGTLRDSLVVGKTANSHEVPWDVLGTAVYFEKARLRDVTFARYRHEDRKRAAAIGVLASQSRDVPSMSGIKFRNSRRVRVPALWHTTPPAAAFRDADGSVLGTGKASTIVGNYPLIKVPSCRNNTDIQGSVCPTGMKVGNFRLYDRTGSKKAMGAKVRRDDGVTAAGLPMKEMGVGVTASGVFNHRYLFKPDRAVPKRVEWAVTAARAGWVELAMPWKHGRPYVYNALGKWATPLKPASNRSEFREGGTYWQHDGLVEIRIETDGKKRGYNQWVCAEEGCG